MINRLYESPSTVTFFSYNSSFHEFGSKDVSFYKTLQCIVENIYMAFQLKPIDKINFLLALTYKDERTLFKNDTHNRLQL